MQRRECIRPPNLPIPDPLLERILPRNPQMVSIVPARDIVTKINGLGKDPDRPADPVALAKDRLGDPPPSQAVVERCKLEPKTFLVRKSELDVLDYENPKRR